MALPQGFRLAAAAADFRGKGKTRDDLALVISERPAAAAGVFTTNLFRAAPVLVAQENLAQTTVDASAGGGMDKVKVNGGMQLESITIDPDAVDPEDVEMLQDMIVAAVNEGIRQVTELANKQMGAITGGLNIPGMPF